MILAKIKTKKQLIKEGWKLVSVGLNNPCGGLDIVGPMMPVLGKIFLFKAGPYDRRSYLTTIGNNLEGYCWHVSSVIILNSPLAQLLYKGE